jgi:hypothetical protein
MNRATALISAGITGPQYPPADTNTVNRSWTPKRARPVVENDAYAAFAHRILTAYARRVATGDVDALPRSESRRLPLAARRRRRAHLRGGRSDHVVLVSRS